MTVEEKRHRLERWCADKRETCEGCPLEHSKGCYGPATSDKVVEFNYKVVFCDAPSETDPTTDMVNSPTHYALPGGMEVIDVEIATQGEEAVKEHCICAAIEYLLRRKKKNGDEDVRKAHWWLSKYIEILEKEAT